MYAQLGFALLDFCAHLEFMRNKILCALNFMQFVIYATAFYAHLYFMRNGDFMRILILCTTGLAEWVQWLGTWVSFCEVLTIAG
jgi:hypothetical protein